VTLHKAAITTVTVLSPDGRPVVGASVGLVSPGAWLSLKAGGLAQQQHQSAGRLLETDAEGHFRHPPDDAISHVVVANLQGFADAVPAALPANPNLQLQPWVVWKEPICPAAGPRQDAWCSSNTAATI